MTPMLRRFLSFEFMANLSGRRSSFERRCCLVGRCRTQARFTWRLTSVVQTAAGARAHGNHAPAIGNRGDQLVVSAHGGTLKNKNPGGWSLPGLLLPEGAQPSGT